MRRKVSGEIDQMHGRAGEIIGLIVILCTCGVDTYSDRVSLILLWLAKNIGAILFMLAINICPGS